MSLSSCVVVASPFSWKPIICYAFRPKELSFDEGTIARLLLALGCMISGQSQSVPTIKNIPGIDVLWHGPEQIEIVNKSDQDILTFELRIDLADNRSFLRGFLAFDERAKPAIHKGGSFLYRGIAFPGDADLYTAPIISLSVSAAVFADGTVAGPNRAPVRAMMEGRWRAQRAALSDFAQIARSRGADAALKHLVALQTTAQALPPEDNEYVLHLTDLVRVLSRQVQKNGTDATVEYATRRALAIAAGPQHTKEVEQ